MNESHLSSLKIMVENFLKSDFFYGLFCHGSHGIGKTTVVSNTLTENQIPFATLSGYSTPLYFYNYLYKKKNKVILLDACVGIFENRALGLPLIKGALGLHEPDSLNNAMQGTTPRERIIRWDTSTHKAVAKEFEFTGKLIVISDTVPILKGVNAAVFKSRCLTYQINLDKNQRLEMLSDAVKSKADKVVYAFLKENADKISVEKLNYYTLLKGSELYTIERQLWKRLLLPTLPENQNQPPQPTHQ